MQSAEPIHLMYAANGGNIMYNEEAATQGSNDQDNESHDSKEKKTPRRYLSAKEEECLFEIWGRDNWRLTQPGKNMNIFNKWSQELKERFNVDIKPLEIQNKVNTTRVKFRQVLKQSATDKTACTRWKKFNLVEKILRNQYRSLDAEEVSPEDLMKNRDMAFIESMTGLINESNIQPIELRCSTEKDNTIGLNSNDKNENLFATNTYELSVPDNIGMTMKTDLTNILIAHENGQHAQIYHYLQQPQQQQHGDPHNEKHDQHLFMSSQKIGNPEYYEDHEQQQQQQQHEQLLQLQQQQPLQNMQVLHPQQTQETINSYMSISQGNQNQNTMHVSVIQTNQNQQVLQAHQQIQEQYQQPLVLPAQHQNQNEQDQITFIKPEPPSTSIQQDQNQVNNVTTNQWSNQKRTPNSHTKRTYKSRTSNINKNNVFQNSNHKIDDTFMMNEFPQTFTTTFPPGVSVNKKRRISSLANSKEILKFREEWLKQQEVKAQNQSQEQQTSQQDEKEAKATDTEVVSNTSLKGATEVEMLYLAEVCRRNEILTEQRNISYKLLRLEERKVALMESFFPKCFKLQEEILEQSMNGTKNNQQKSTQIIEEKNSELMCGEKTENNV